MAVKIAPFSTSTIFEESNKALLRIRWASRIWKKNEGETLTVEPTTKVLKLRIENKISVFSVLQSVLFGTFLLFLVLKKPWSFPLLLIPLSVLLFTHPQLVEDLD